MNKKAFLDISFSWIFAILVGGMILFAAFYGINKFSDLKEVQSSAESGTTLNNLLNPLETGIESGKSIDLILAIDSKLNNYCDPGGNFGKQIISVQEKIKGEWTKGINISFQNKYLFFPSTEEGKKFKVFTKPFEFPFKVANLMYLTNSEDIYCFTGSVPSSIERELKNLKQENLLIEPCPRDSINVCFDGGSDCDIQVDYISRKIVAKGSNPEIYFEGDALMYAAIFSDEGVYECELERLMKRTKELASIYQEKAINLISSNCNSAASTDLSYLIQDLNSYQDSSNLVLFSNTIKSMNLKNRNSGCELW